MTIRMSGMVSGIDTESLVSAMVSTYVSKKEKYQKAQTKLSYKQDAWKALNTKVYSLYSSISSLRFSSAYSMKKTTVSDATKATITAGSNAINGTQSLQIKQLARSGYITGAKLAKGTTEDTTLASLGYTGADTTISVKTASGTKDITIGKDSKISDVVKAMNDAGVKASFDATNSRMFVSSTETGTANDFALTAADGNGLKVLSSLGILVKSDATDAAYKANAAYALGTMGTDADGNVVSYFELDDDGNIKYDSDGKAIVRAGVTYSASETQKAIQEIMEKLANAYDSNSKLDAEKKELTSKIDYTEAKNAVNDVLAKDKGSRLIQLLKTENQDKTYVGPDGQTYTGRSEVKDNDGNVTGYHYYNTKTIKVNGTYLDVEDEDKPSLDVSADEKIELASEEINTLAEKLGLITKKTETAEDGTETEKTDSTALNTLKSQLKTVMAVDDNAIYTDEDKAAYYLSDDQMTEAKARLEEIALATKANDATIAANSYWDVKDYSAYYENGVLSSDKLADLAASITDKITTAKEIVTGETAFAYNEGATRVDAQDATIILNDAEFTSSTNTFNINGLTIKALATTAAGETLSINTDTDTQGLYDKIKDFLSQYNEIINEITSLYNADSAKGYDPLTDDEKSSMSDSEIEKWETKIKDAILRKDSTLGTIQNAMTSAMMQSYTVNGKSYSLASFGISTLGYLNASKNENYAYHIDGDSEDTATAGKTDKLMTALENDPDSVIDFMKQLTSGLYTALDKQMKGTNLRSTYTIYNDKQMASEYSNYTTLIKQWEEKIQDYEDRYYSQFSKMESSLAKLQSSTSSLSSLFGNS